MPFRSLKIADELLFTSKGQNSFTVGQNRHRRLITDLFLLNEDVSSINNIERDWIISRVVVLVTYLDCLIFPRLINGIKPFLINFDKFLIYYS